MKIIQLLGKIDGYGVTRYIIELNAALKMEGHDVEIVHFRSNIKAESATQAIPDLITMDYGPELVEKLNSCDILLINTLIDKKAKDEYRTNFYKLASEVTEPIKAIFCNDHNSTAGYVTYVNEFAGDLDFVKNIDKFVTFSPYNPNFQKINKVYPEIMQKYVHLQHPYRFTGEDYVDFDKKYRRVSYIGRFSHLKDPMMLIRHKAEFTASNYQLEMRGLDRSPAVAFTPGVVYDFHEDGTRTPAAGTLELISTKNIEKLYPGLPVDLIHLNDRDMSKVYLFGRYKREEGIEAVSYAMFGCNFNHNKIQLRLGDNIEYSIAEIIDAGTIPLVNYDTMYNCMLYDEDGNRTDISALSQPCGICFKRDGSNVNDAIAQMNELAGDKAKYDTYRKECLEFYKKLYDPKKVASKLIKDLTSTDNSKALAEFGF